jgi:hypothetical protein
MMGLRVRQAIRFATLILEDYVADFISPFARLSTARNRISCTHSVILLLRLDSTIRHCYGNWRRNRYSRNTLVLRKSWTWKGLQLIIVVVVVFVDFAMSDLVGIESCQGNSHRSLWCCYLGSAWFLFLFQAILTSSLLFFLPFLDLSRTPSAKSKSCA